MKEMRNLSKLLLIILLALTVAPGYSAEAKKRSTRAKYVFFFIGDGMSMAQINLAEAALSMSEFSGEESKIGVGKLNMRELTTTGICNTHAENRYITGSAASATALATGSKTAIDYISVSSSGETLRTMAEMAKAKGMKVGIVSSVSIDHATPAAFYAHTESRSNYEIIDNHLIESGFDYFAGGSVKWDRHAVGDKKLAYDAYMQKLEDAGYQYVSSRAEFDALKGSSNTPVMATIESVGPGLDTSDGSALPYVIDLKYETNEDNTITLAEFTAKGAEILMNDEGFFMMVEGGKIDWACHANDAASAAYEMIALDEAIGEALEFAAQHPDETLIVLTGDHDCGGLTLGFAGTGYQTAFGLLANQTMSYDLFSSKVSTMIEGGESFEKLLSFACEVFGFTNDVTDGSEGVFNRTTELSDHEVAMLRKAYEASLNSRKGVGYHIDDVYNGSFGGYEPFTVKCTNILNNKAGIDFASYSHTAVPVPVFVKGVSEEIFSGYYDNTDVAKKIMEAAGL